MQSGGSERPLGVPRCKWQRRSTHRRELIMDVERDMEGETSTEYNTYDNNIQDGEMRSKLREWRNRFSVQHAKESIAIALWLVFGAT